MSACQVGILGLGCYLPEKVLTNADLEKMVDTSDEWIRTRTGIAERRIAEKGTPTSTLAAKAGDRALRSAGLKASDIDLIIVATISPDMIFPATACLVQDKIGAKCPSFDLSAACSGFPYAISVAQGMIASGGFRKVLIIAAEVITGFIDWTDRSTCVLFGDGAGAAVLGEVKDEHRILSTYMGTDGSQANLLQIPAGGSAVPTSLESVNARAHYLQMAGSEVFRAAVRTMSEAIDEVARRAGLRIEDIDCLIPHQANMRIIQAISERSKFPKEKIYINLDRYGNMSAASTAVALCEAVEEGKIKKGDNVVIAAFGGGLTWASCAIKW